MQQCLSLSACGKKDSPKLPEQVPQASQAVAPEPVQLKPLSKQALNALAAKVMLHHSRAKSGACYLEKNSFNHTYCLKIKSVNAVPDPAGGPETVYILAMGDIVNADEAGHVEGGMAAMFAVQPDPDGKGGYLTVAKKPAFEAGGGFGYGGEGRFTSLGSNRYGWKLTAGFTNQGVSEETTVTFGIKDGKVVELGSRTRTLR